MVQELRGLVEACAPTVLCIVETQIAKYRVEGLAGSLGFSSSFGVGSSGRSEGLCMYWKDCVEVEIKSFSQYHIDSIVKESEKDPWRLTCFCGAANRSLHYKILGYDEVPAWRKHLAMGMYW